MKVIVKLPAVSGITKTGGEEIAHFIKLIFRSILVVYGIHDTVPQVEFIQSEEPVGKIIVDTGFKPVDGIEEALKTALGVVLIVAARTLMVRKRSFTTEINFLPSP